MDPASLDATLEESGISAEALAAVPPPVQPNPVADDHMSALHQLAGAMNPQPTMPSNLAHSSHVPQPFPMQAGHPGMNGHDANGFPGEEGIDDPSDPNRKPGSGRPAGVQCKCKCCGALGDDLSTSTFFTLNHGSKANSEPSLTLNMSDVDTGFYRRSCGRKHRCLIGKCGPAGPGNMGPEGIDPEGDKMDEAPTMYQVLIAPPRAPIEKEMICFSTV